ncbi:hypothetical protein ACM01_22645 [Streptomyces viridochromogenes]|uniref:ABC-type glycine betaine transport system substrate-binding domain-containing protein n=1 Tax=Streptomyces viridochromogenes TaxID=1938 RepID=A0A0J7Z9W2_STRVR|nr:hypothetical protein ACM01_22645 [Streptomyces viridochromogenes]
MRQDDHPADDQPDGGAELRRSIGYVIQANDWVVLSDPRNLVPGRHVVPLIVDRKADSTVRKAPARLGNTLTTAQLTELDRQVDKDKKGPEDVASAYAQEHGLVK